MKTIDINDILTTSLTEQSSFDNIEDGSVLVLGNPDTRVLLKKHVVLICRNGDFSFESSSGIHQCRSGGMCLLVKDSFCRFISISEDCRIAGMFSSTTSMHVEASSRPNLMMFLRQFIENPVIYLSEDELEDSFSLFKYIKRVSGRYDYRFRKEMIQTCNVTMFYIFMGHLHIYEQQNSFKSSRGKAIFDTFLKNVGEHFREQRKLEYYAGLQCVSVKHLSNVVLKQSGISARQWICDFVMIEARELLSGGNNSVQQVADALHFANQSFFGKFFKAHEGLSPIQYQQK